MWVPTILLGIGLILNGLLSLGGWGVRVSEVSSRQIGGGLLVFVGAWLMGLNEPVWFAASANAGERK
jgi:hypothetical protein